MTRLLLAALWLATVAATYRDDGGRIEAWTHLTRERAVALGNHHPRQKVYGLAFSQEKLREVLDLCCGWTVPPAATVMVIESTVPIRAVGDSCRVCRPPAEYTDGNGYTYFVVWPGAVPDTVCVAARDSTLVLKERCDG